MNFFGKKKVKYSYDLAVEVCAECGFSSQAEYLRKVNKDNFEKLPSRPHETFKKEWIDWDSYLGIPYLDPASAKRTALKLGLNTAELYQGCKSRPKSLPEDPVNYFSFDEAIKYCQENRIRDRNAYLTAAKMQKRLYWPPEKTNGYTTAKDLYYQPDEFEKLFEELGKYGDFIFVARRFSTIGANLPKKAYLTRFFIKDYLARHNQPQHPGAFLNVRHSAPPIEPFIEGLSPSDRGRNTLIILKDFLDECLKEYCTDVNKDTGHRWVLPEFCNHLAGQHLGLVPKQTQSETVKSIIPFEYILKARRYLAPVEARSLSDLSESISLFDCDWYEVDVSKIDANDPNCVYRFRESDSNITAEKNTIYEMWSPVRCIAILSLLYLPLRGQQILWCDSGEADKEIPDLKNGKLTWIGNLGHLAGQFKEPQSFIKKLKDGGFGMHSTTNKTQQMEGGYDIPWMPEELIPWLIILRNWQSKYNPISEPFYWPNMPIKFDKKRLQRRGYKGKQCFLFRDPKVSLASKRCQPLKATMFKSSVAAILYKIQDEQLPLAQLKSGANVDSP